MFERARALGYAVGLVELIDERTNRFTDVQLSAGDKLSCLNIKVSLSISLLVSSKIRPPIQKTPSQTVSGASTQDADGGASPSVRRG